jgi:hypothetical protein
MQTVHGRSPHRKLIGILQTLVDEDNYGRLGEIGIPCNILYGLSDKTTSAPHSEGLHQGIAGSCIVPVPGVTTKCSYYQRCISTNCYTPGLESIVVCIYTLLSFIKTGFAFTSCTPTMTLGMSLLVCTCQVDRRLSLSHH